ncbi:MAG: NAD(P)H-hydrate dehydratase [Rhodocyclales bacterium]|nr:NAD(P)H-hydrate dehydratase [Rhodocyclales bacterium]
MPTPAHPLYQAAGLRAIEAAAAEQPLMQRAGRAAADFAGDLVADRQAPILVLAGPGNNGGDGFEMAMHLLDQGHDVRLVFAGDAAKLPADAAAARRRFLAAGGAELAEIPAGVRFRLIVDALFGIGLQRPLAGHFAALVEAANALAGACRCPLLALDCPSGLDADTGAVRGGHVVRASHTLTFIALKPGLLTADGPDHCGILRLAPLALDAAALAAPGGQTVAVADFVAQLKPRRRNSHKGSNGSAGILGGAPSMLGAAFLAGRAALQLGAGRVYLGLVDPAAPGFDPLQPELMLRGADALLATELSALACGPGLGGGPAQVALLEAACALDLPLLLDADALNLLAGEGNLEVAVASRQAPTLLTPHPAEAARLLDRDVAAVQADRIAAACELAAQFNAEVALKGCGTVLASPDGRWRINTTGNPGMGSAGMGDVLSGLVVALLAQGWPAAQALAAGVHLHGAAADELVASGVNNEFAPIGGECGLTAGETIPAARRLFNRWLAAHG